MRVKKTRQDQRGVYRYEVDVPNGKGGYRRTYNVIKPGEDGVTEVMIQDLHRMDDNWVMTSRCQRLWKTRRSRLSFRGSTA